MSVFVAGVVVEAERDEGELVVMVVGFSVGLEVVVGVGVVVGVEIEVAVVVVGV